MHLGDIQEALGIEVERTGEFLRGALARYCWALNEHLRGQGLEGVAIIGTAPHFEGGELTSSHRVSGTSYELLRAITGRRSRAEADRVLSWGSTPEAIRDVLPIYDWLETDSGASARRVLPSSQP